MTPSSRVTIWIVRDAVHQALSSSGLWVLLIIGLLGGLVALSANGDGELDLGGSGWSAYAWLGAWLPNTVGVLLALFATSGLLPAFLEPRHALVLFAKPTRRGYIMAARFCGICMIVLAVAATYYFGTWMILGLRTGRWPAAYLTGWVVFAIEFTAFFSCSALLAVTCRSVGVVALGSGLFWFVSLLTNIGRHVVTVYDPPQFRRISVSLIEIAYWCLPRPLDAAGLLHDTLGPSPLSETWDWWRRLTESGEVWPIGSLLATVVLTFLVAAVASYDLETRDY